MALVTTVSAVVGILGAMAVLLWFATYIEARVFPAATDTPAGEPRLDVVAIDSASEHLSSAA